MKDMLREYDDVITTIDKYSSTIFKICYIYLKNRSDAEDAFQDLVIKIMEKAPIFNNENHEKAWIIKVATNHCKNILRLKKIKSYVLLNEEIVSTIDHQDNTLKYILELPLHYRNVLYLYYYEGYKSKEIARILNKNEATIRTWLRRARENLKELLGGDCFE